MTSDGDGGNADGAATTPPNPVIAVPAASTTANVRHSEVEKLFLRAKLDIPKYNPSVDFEVWQHRFNALCAEFDVHANGVKKIKILAQLDLSTALPAVIHLNLDPNLSYADLVNALRTRFAKFGDRSEFRSAFRKRKQAPDENLDKFLDELTDLAIGAFSGDQARVEEEILEVLPSAIHAPTDIREQLVRAAPTSVEAAKNLIKREFLAKSAVSQMGASAAISHKRKSDKCNASDLETSGIGQSEAAELKVLRKQVATQSKELIALQKQMAAQVKLTNELETARVDNQPSGGYGYSNYGPRYPGRAWGQHNGNWATRTRPQFRRNDVGWNGNHQFQRGAFRSRANRNRFCAPQPVAPPNTQVSENSRQGFKGSP